MLKKLIKKSLLFMILIYQKVISPWTPSSCRYSPTCSFYAMDALDKYDLSKGLKLILLRISSCHPWGGSGHDPVP